jgi:hypothetical protein
VTRGRQSRRLALLLLLALGLVVTTVAVAQFGPRYLAGAPLSTPDARLPALKSTIDRDQATNLIRKSRDVGRVDRIDAKLMTYSEYTAGAGPVRTHEGNPATPPTTGFAMSGDPSKRVLWVVAVSGEVWPTGRDPVFFGLQTSSATPYPPYRWATFLIDALSGQQIVVGDVGIETSWPTTFDGLPAHSIDR